MRSEFSHGTATVWSPTCLKRCSATARKPCRHLTVAQLLCVAHSPRSTTSASRRQSCSPRCFPSLPVMGPRLRPPRPTTSSTSSCNRESKIQNRKSQRPQSSSALCASSSRASTPSPRRRGNIRARCTSPSARCVTNSAAACARACARCSSPSARSLAALRLCLSIRAVGFVRPRTARRR
jgi:hypothetical protein